MSGILDFFSTERGQARTRALNEAVTGLLSEYLGPTGIPQRLEGLMSMTPAAGVQESIAGTRTALDTSLSPSERLQGVGQAALGIGTTVAPAAAARLMPTVPGASLSDDFARSSAALEDSLLGYGRDFSASESGMFAGRNAANADLDALAKAERLAKEGADREDIWKATGWFQGVDGKWRFEIDDSGLNLDLSRLPVETSRDGSQFYRVGPHGDALAHDGLFSAYPDLASVDRVSYDFPSGSGKAGEYQRPGLLGESITTWKAGNNPATDLHELQHAIQEREGFASGSSPATAGKYAPPNPKYSEQMANREVIERARGYYKSQSYKDDLERYNAHYKKHWSVKFEGLENELAASDLDFGEWTERWDALHAAEIEDKARNFPNLDYLDRVARKYGLEDASPTLSPMETYRRVAGEVEARNVANRQSMSPQERLESPPWLTQDFPDEEQIILFDGGSRKGLLQ